MKGEPMKRYFLLISLVAIVVGIGSKGRTDPQREPKPTGDLGHTAAELDRVLSELETLLDSPVWNQRSIQTVTVNGEEIYRSETRTDREILRTRRYLDPTR